MSINWLELQSLKPYFNEKLDEVEKVSSLEKTEKIKPLSENDFHQKNKRTLSHINKTKLQNAYNELKKDTHEDMQISRVMTKNVDYINITDSIEVLIQKFQNLKYHQFPVLSKGKVCGMVFDDELLNFYINGYVRKDLDISRLVTNRLLTVFESSSISQVALIMLKEDINAAPIINEKIELCGIVTLSDLVHAIFCHKMLDLRV